ncbi:heme o synthase [Gracilibacillus dipsosauri]|uniref:heme o synthase n=1 Tax=Gracilibacillus dipsosauri TaxID=178340 RepID=UPI00240A0A80
MILRYLLDLKHLFKRFVLIANVMPALFGFFIALKYYELSFMEYIGDFVLLTIGSNLLVAGSLALNNWLEADVDRLMERTKDRPTVTGSMSLRSILTIGIVLSIIGEILLFTINIEVGLLGFIGWYTYVVVYTVWTKRRFTWNTHVGSFSGAVTPVMGWAVVETSTLHVIPFSLFLIMFLWQMPHTYAIAIRKSEDYARSGLQMLPVIKGYQTTIRRTAIYIGLLVILPFMLDSFSMFFYLVISVLNIGWFIVALIGFKASDKKKWARVLFVSSLIYLLSVFIIYLIFV